MIDSHAHVAFAAFDQDREQVIKRLPAAGVIGWIEVGTDLEQSGAAVALSGKHNNCWATVGVHPDDVASLDESVWAELEQLANHPRVKAIGEVGFDFYRGGPELRGVQGEALARFVQLAFKFKLPMVFHVRDSAGTANAHAAMLEFLKSYSRDERPAGVMHTFSGTLEQAEQYLELGMHLSFSGVVTYHKKAEAAQSVAAITPADRLLIETDCPFLTPEPYRGKRNEPAHVCLVAEKIAALRGVSLPEIDRLTEENTRRLFRLDTI